MCFVIVEFAVIAAHNLIAFATGIFELNLITAPSKISSIAN